MADNNVFKVIVDDESKKMSIELGSYERIAALDEMGKAAQQMSKMAKWMDDPTVLDEAKDEWMPVFQNLIKTVDHLWFILELAGVSVSEIREHAQIPF